MFTEKEKLLAEIVQLIRDSEENIADVQQENSDMVVRRRNSDTRCSHGTLSRHENRCSHQSCTDRSRAIVANDDTDATDATAKGADVPEKDESEQRPKRKL